MTQHWIPDAAVEAGPARRLFALRDVLALVEQIAGRPPTCRGTDIAEAARLSAAWANALPIVQHRFEREAAQAALAAAAGAEALLRLEEQGRFSQAAAVRLADHLEGTLARLAGLLDS